MKAYSHLSAQERIRIDELRNREGLGVCQIALRIGRDKSTVSREPGRGPWFASDENGSYRPYRPKRLKAVFRCSYTLSSVWVCCFGLVVECIHWMARCSS